MKIQTFLLLTGLTMLFVDCKHGDNLQPEPNQQPFFNQVNIALTDSQFGCLVDQWYHHRFANEPIAFRVLNDNQAYTDFFTFTCNQPTSLASLTPIDFSKNSLLIGVKADYGAFINTPGNITQITQQLLPTTMDTYRLQVDVTGSGSDTARTGGHEWFGFVSVVPKVSGTTILDMHYHFQ